MLTIVLVATEWTETFENLRRSLHIFGYSYVVLGWGKKWQGWKWRSKLYLDFIEQQNPKNIFVFMDAYDTLATKHPHQVLAAYHAYKKPLVIGAEWYCGNPKNCGNVQRWWSRQATKQPRKKHLNAGFVMGNASMLKNVYAWMASSTLEDDQLALSHWVNTFGDSIVALDTGSALMCNVHVVDGFGHLKTSCFHHFPGPLLKLGLFPQYNHACRKTLGIHSRYKYPSFSVEALIYLGLIFLVYGFYVYLQRCKLGTHSLIQSLKNKR